MAAGGCHGSAGTAAGITNGAASVDAGRSQPSSQQSVTELEGTGQGNGRARQASLGRH